MTLTLPMTCPYIRVVVVGIQFVRSSAERVPKHLNSFSTTISSILLVLEQGQL